GSSLFSVIACSPLSGFPSLKTPGMHAVESPPPRKPSKVERVPEPACAAHTTMPRLPPPTSLHWVFVQVMKMPRSCATDRLLMPFDGDWFSFGKDSHEIPSRA